MPTMLARMKQLALTPDGFLVDSDGIRFRRGIPLAEIECRMQTGWLPWYSRDFQNAVEEMDPLHPNAYCDLGRIRHIVDDHRLDDGTLVSTSYEIHLVEIYHVGD